MARCAAITRGGTRCKGVATGDATYCYAHDPSKDEERRRNNRRAGKAGGQGRPSGLSETAEAKRWVKGLIGRLLSDDPARRIDRAVAATCFMGVNTLARLIEQERRIVEQEQVIERLDALETALDNPSDLGRGVG